MSKKTTEFGIKDESGYMSKEAQAIFAKKNKNDSKNSKKTTKKTK